MQSGLYGKWMTAWETKLTTRDTNRIIRPLEWGFDWLKDFISANSARSVAPATPNPAVTLSVQFQDHSAFQDLDRMVALNEEIVRLSDVFFGYQVPQDFRIEYRHPELFPTNVRPETLAQEAEMKRQSAAGEIGEAQFLRFTSAVRTPYPENDQMNARWYPAPDHKDPLGRPPKPKQAIIVLPQWNSDAISHNVLCTLFNRFGISALRLSQPYHDIRRPVELERSDYAVSANIGRTLASCRQAVVDIRSCMDWLETQGYSQFGVLGTSLGSCYAFIAAAHDPRLRVCAFNHASTWFGDVVWEGQSTRHVRAALEDSGLTQDQVRTMFLGISPMAYMQRFATTPKRVLVVHATYDLTFPLHLSLEVLNQFRQHGIDFVSKVLPCGHYTTGETPYKYIDGWYLGSFIYRAFRDLAHKCLPA
jgi:dienelactone hydrolase